MTPRRFSQWAIFFGVLTVFTFSVAYTALTEGGLHTAYAQAAANPGNAILAFDESPHSPGFLNSLARLFANHTVCSVTPEELADLSAKYDTTLETISLNGADVTLVTITDHKLKPAALKDSIRSETCKLVKRAHVFYLIFGGAVS